MTKRRKSIEEEFLEMRRLIPGSDLFRNGAKEGWSSARGYVIKTPGALNPNRQGVRWTPKEDFDLLQAFRRGVSVEELAKRHQRTVGGITSRLNPEHNRAINGAKKYRGPADIPVRDFTHRNNQPHQHGAAP